MGCVWNHEYMKIIRVVGEVTAELTSFIRKAPAISKLKAFGRIVTTALP
jgi:hypothetical protein